MHLLDDALQKPGFLQQYIRVFDLINNFFFTFLNGDFVWPPEHKNYSFKYSLPSPLGGGVNLTKIILTLTYTYLHKSCTCNGIRLGGPTDDLILNIESRNIFYFYFKRLSCKIMRILSIFKTWMGSDKKRWTTLFESSHPSLSSFYIQPPQDKPVTKTCCLSCV